MKQLDLFTDKIPEWKKRGFKSREEWLRAKEFDRAWRHMEQVNMTRLRNKYIAQNRNNFFSVIKRTIRKFLK
tara:strand:- start:329 stop:544 length:216 start_codon:yes stop_codon:yes gene_type:complete